MSTMATPGRFLDSRSIRELTCTLVFGDTGVATNMFTLPAGARIKAWLFHVKTAFNAGNNQVDIGTEASAAAYVSNQSVAATGTFMADTEDANPNAVLTTKTDIYMTVDAAASTTGEVDVTCVFSMSQNRRF